MNNNFKYKRWYIQDHANNISKYCYYNKNDLYRFFIRRTHPSFSLLINMTSRLKFNNYILKIFI